MANETRPEHHIDRETAYLVLAAGAVAGIALMVWPLFPFKWWWEPLMQWLREGAREQAWRPLLVLLSELAGLAVMFACFQYVRPLERIDATVRVVLYGYNAGLTGVLLVLLLGIANLFVNIFMPTFLDTTQGSFHSISEVTRKYVTDLDQPVKVYLVMSQRDPAYSNMHALLTTLRDLNPSKFEFEEVSPTLNRTRIGDLQRDFPQLEKFGLIVTYETEKNYSLIPTTELTSVDFDMQTAEREKRLFNGEVRLMQELFFLAEGRKKTVIYFTQGHGEPAFDDRTGRGMGRLAARLRENNYDVRPLEFKDETAAVPADADLVVVLGPTRAMPLAAEALDKYMAQPRAEGKKGKLVVLLGPTPPATEAGNVMRQTGLETLLRKYNIEVSNEKILTLASPENVIRVDQSPELVSVTASPTAASEQHPLAMNFKDELLVWFQVREVRPLTANPSIRATTIMFAIGSMWKETNMSKRVSDDFRELATNAAARKGRVSREALSVMVTASEMSSDPHAFSKPGGGQTPRVAVLGTSAFATDEFLSSNAYDLIRGSIDWSRERFSNIGVQPKSHKNYTLPEKLSLGKLWALPAAAMIFGILGLGAVVWTMRRR